MPSTSLVVIACTLACTAPDARKQAEAVVARAAVSAESVKAAAAAATPSTGRWDEAHLTERLVRSGLAPQALAAESAVEGAAPWWGVPAHSYRVGNATLHAFIYADSAARLRATGGLDTLTAAPRGGASPYGLPRLLIVNNNLAAVLVGGSERQQERVSLALTAGLPAATNK